VIKLFCFCFVSFCLYVIVAFCLLCVLVVLMVLIEDNQFFFEERDNVMCGFVE